MQISNLKSLFLALALVPSIQAAPVADVHVVYKTVTIFESVTAEIPTGVAFDHHPKHTRSASSFSSNYPSASASASAPVSAIVSAPASATPYDGDNDEAASDYYEATSVSTSASSSEATETSSTAISSSTSTSIFDSSVVYNGVATFYSVSNDNCGTTSSDSDYVCAISQQMYNTVASSDSISEYCGHLINITYNGKTIQVKVVDSCESCDSTHLDLSPSAFSALADQDLGVIDIQWEWAS